MLNIIYSEFLKLKKSYILIIALISGILMPGMKVIENIKNDSSAVPLSDRERFFQYDVFDIDTANLTSFGATLSIAYFETHLNLPGHPVFKNKCPLHLSAFF